MSNVSYRPVHDMALSFEHACVRKILCVLKVSRQIPYELRTDAVLFKPLKRKPVDVSLLRFRDLHLLRRQFCSVPGVRALDDRFEPTPILSEEPVFRTHAAASTDFLPCTPDTPKRTGTAPQVARRWQYIASAERERS